MSDTNETAEKGTDHCTDDTERLSEWLEEQKQRANDRIADDRVGREETLRWKGERDLIDSIQSYLGMGVLSTESSDGYLKFAHENIGCIIDGYEDVTIRVGLDREFEPGQEIDLISPKERVFGRAVVEEVYDGRLGQVHFDAVFVDKRTHPSHSDEDLLKRLRRHYGRDITFDTKVTAIYFKPVELRTPRELQPGSDHEEVR